MVCKTSASLYFQPRSRLLMEPFRKSLLCTADCCPRPCGRYWAVSQSWLLSPSTRNRPALLSFQKQQLQLLLRCRCPRPFPCLPTLAKYASQPRNHIPSTPFKLFLRRSLGDDRGWRVSERQLQHLPDMYLLDYTPFSSCLKHCVVIEILGHTEQTHPLLHSILIGSTGNPGLGNC